MAERRRPAPLIAAVAATAFGVAVEMAAGAPQGLALAIADFAVGLALVAGGALTWTRRPASRAGLWMWTGGVAWFGGTLGWALVFLHRGPLVHLQLSYPTGRPTTRLARVVVAAAYFDAVVVPIARDDRLTITLGVLVAFTAARAFLRSGGPARKAASPALIAALLFAGALTLGAVLRVFGVAADRDVLWIYDGAVAVMAGVLAADLLRARWTRAVLTGLVVDLDDLGVATSLQARLARALGDPSLVVVSWSRAANEYVDASGRAVPLPPAGSTRKATAVEDGGKELAVIVHDQAVLGDTALVAAAASLASVALANGHLNSAVQTQLREIAASRRRLVEAADAERRRLEYLLAEGPLQRMRRVAELLGADQGGLSGELQAATLELAELANGVRPSTLTSGGLAIAIPELALRSSPKATAVVAGVGRLPDAIEAAAYFVCSEALANTAKHSAASAVNVRASLEGDQLVLEVGDDGIGGADVRGSGLRGLADRVEALGGSLTVQSAPATGTRLVAQLPTGEVHEP